MNSGLVMLFCVANCSMRLVSLINQIIGLCYLLFIFIFLCAFRCRDLLEVGEFCSNGVIIECVLVVHFVMRIDR